MKLSEEEVECLKNLVNYCWADEKKQWEETMDKTFDEKEKCIPTQEENHIFYDLFVLNKFINKIEGEADDKQRNVEGS